MSLQRAGPEHPTAMRFVAFVQKPFPIAATLPANEKRMPERHNPRWGLPSCNVPATG